MSENITNGTELEKIDLLSMLSDFLHRYRKLWWVSLVLTLLFGAASYYRVSTTYSPSYLAEATVSVEIVNGNARGNQNTAEQMGSIFPYILTSGALSDVIAADLGTNGVPGTIRVTNISGTNLLTISVTSADPDNAYNVLQSVMKNYPEVAQYVVGQTKLNVIDENGVPTDTSRSSVIRGSVAKGALVGFGLSLFIVMLSAMSMRTIRTESELRAMLNIPCLGTLPTCRRKQRRRTKDLGINILLDANRGEYIEAMRLIRTRLERQLGEKKVLLVTSSIAGEGNSTVAANLAISMALKGKRVVLVDCDLHNPSVGGLFRLKQKFPGLVPLLRGRCSLEDALYEVTANGSSVGLTLLPGGERETHLVEILGSEAMGALVERLRERFDMVILDTPPSVILVDAMMLINHVDAVTYVVMNDFARRRFIFNGVSELMAGDAPIVGCILNGGKTRAGAYGYYRYGYGYGYTKPGNQPVAVEEEAPARKRRENKDTASRSRRQTGVQKKPAPKQEQKT